MFQNPSDYLESEKNTHFGTLLLGGVGGGGWWRGGAGEGRGTVSNSVTIYDNKIKTRN